LSFRFVALCLSIFICLFAERAAEAAVVVAFVFAGLPLWAFYFYFWRALNFLPLGSVSMCVSVTSEKKRNEEEPACRMEIGSGCGVGMGNMEMVG